MKLKRKARKVLSLVLAFTMATSLFTGVGVSTVSAEDVATGGAGTFVLPIEAEAGTLSEVAGFLIVKNKACSNEYMVTGMTANTAASISFTVNAAASGTYALKIYHEVVADDRAIDVKVNGSAKTVACQKAEANAEGITSVSTEVTLVAGPNTIELASNVSKPAPNIDKIEIVQTSAEAVKTVDAMLAALPAADAVTDANKMVVTGVKVSHDALADKTGLTAANVAKLTAAMAKVEELNAMRKLVGTYLPIEAELVCALSGSTITPQKAEEASNGYYIGNIGGASDNKVTYNVNVKEAGPRLLKIYYATAEPRNFEVSVNGATPVKVPCTKGDWSKDTAVEIVVNLKIGPNTIVFGGENKGAAPDLDKIEVELMPAELVSAVNGLFGYIPESVTHENKMLVTAINDAYRAVTDKTGIDEPGMQKLMKQLAAIDVLEGKIGLKYPVFPIEAELGTIGGMSDYKDSTSASNGWFVGNVGGSEANPGTVTFKVQAEEAGPRMLSVYYLTNQTRKLFVSVNNGVPMSATCEGSSWEVPAEEPCQFEVTLLKGENTITLTGNGVVAPDVDCVKLELKATEAAKLVEKQIEALPAALSLDLTRDEKFVNATEESYNALKDVYTQATATELAVSNVSKLEEAVKTIGNMKFGKGDQVALTIEGEVFTPASGAAIMKGEPHPTTSNGYLMGGFVSSATTGTASATINVEAELTTDRELKIYCATVEKRNLTVSVNGSTPVKLSCPGNNRNEWTTPNEDPVTTTISLQKGTNVIKFSTPVGESGPNIDKIVIPMTQNEAQATVSSMINVLPEIISEDNQMIVNAVNNAYVSLTKKENVTNYDKLVLALDRVANLNGQRTAENPLLTLEADLAKVANGAELVNIALATNGSHIRKIEGAATATFNVNSVSAGKRLLTIHYAKKTEEDEVSKLNIAVNDAAPITVNLRGTSDYKSEEQEPRTVVVDLVAGANAIVFSGVSGYDAPRIDKIEIEMLPAEASSEVITMINNLKDAAEFNLQNFDDEKGYVYAVEIAYNSLSAENKKLVTNYSKLKAALDRIKELEIESGLNQEEKDLRAAMDKFDALEETIANLSEAKYTPESWKNVTDAFDAAKTVYDQAKKADPYAPVDVRNFVALVDALEDAVDALLTKDLKYVQDRFVALVGKMEAEDSAKYTPESWKAVTDAYTLAKEEFDKGNKADHNTLDTLCNSFESALGALVSVSKEVTVTFDATGGTPTPAPQTIAAGTKATRPADPVKVGYSVYSWQLDGQDFDFNTAILRDTTLKAKWILTKLKDLLDEFKNNLDGLPDTLDKDEYTDTSWKNFEDAYNSAKDEYDKGADADSDILEDQINKLKDAINGLEEKNPTFTVAFDAAGGAPTPDMVKVKKGEKVAKPAVDPVKDNYVFLGWNDGSVDYNFDLPVTGNKILTAKWIRKDLKDALDALDNIPNRDEYTDESWKAFEDAYNALKAEVAKGENADPNALKALLERLTAAIQGLVKKGAQPEVKAQSIQIHGISKKIAVKKKIKLTADVMPENTTNKAVTWESSNTKYATVSSDGVVKMKKAGKNKKVTITAKAADGSGVVATYKIKIMEKAVKRVVLTAETTVVKAGQKVNIESAVLPSVAAKKINAKLQWVSSNVKYATVTSKGVVKTKKAGKNKTVKITAMATDGSGKKATVKIKLK